MGKMTPEMQIIAICQEMKWDYYTYLRQPIWFINLLKIKLKVDSDNIKKSLKKNG